MGFYVEAEITIKRKVCIEFDDNHPDVSEQDIAKAYAKVCEEDERDVSASNLSFVGDSSDEVDLSLYDEVIDSDHHKRLETN